MVDLQQPPEGQHLKSEQANGPDWALDVWENEGGALGPGWMNEGVRCASQADTELEILRRLGAGVVAKWNELPAGIKKSLFHHATSEDLLCDTVRLRVQFARYLHVRAVAGRGTRIIRTGDN